MVREQSPAEGRTRGAARGLQPAAQAWRDGRPTRAGKRRPRSRTAEGRLHRGGGAAADSGGGSGGGGGVCRAPRDARQVNRGDALGDKLGGGRVATAGGRPTCARSRARVGPLLGQKGLRLMLAREAIRRRNLWREGQCSTRLTRLRRAAHPVAKLCRDNRRSPCSGSYTVTDSSSAPTTTTA